MNKIDLCEQGNTIQIKRSVIKNILKHKNSYEIFIKNNNFKMYNKLYYDEYIEKVEDQEFQNILFDCSKNKSQNNIFNNSEEFLSNEVIAICKDMGLSYMSVVNNDVPGDNSINAKTNMHGVNIYNGANIDLLLSTNREEYTDQEISTNYAILNKNINNSIDRADVVICEIADSF